MKKIYLYTEIEDGKSIFTTAYEKEEDAKKCADERYELASKYFTECSMYTILKRTSGKDGYYMQTYDMTHDKLLTTFFKVEEITLE